MNAAVRDEPNDPKAKSDQTHYYQRNTLGLGHSERVTAYAVFVNTSLGRDQFGKVPDVIGYSRFHCWRHSQT